MCPHGSIEPRLAETGPRADTHLRIHNRYTAARRPAGTGRLFVAAPGQMEGVATCLGTLHLHQVTLSLRKNTSQQDFLNSSRIWKPNVPEFPRGCLPPNGLCEKLSGHSAETAGDKILPGNRPGTFLLSIEAHSTDSILEKCQPQAGKMSLMVLLHTWNLDLDL